MLTLNKNTAICDISTHPFVTKNGKYCLCSELFFVDGSSLKYYDFGKLARQYHCFLKKRMTNPTDNSVEK